MPDARESKAAAIADSATKPPKKTRIHIYPDVTKDPRWEAIKADWQEGYLSQRDIVTLYGLKTAALLKGVDSLGLLRTARSRKDKDHHASEIRRVNEARYRAEAEERSAWEDVPRREGLSRDDQFLEDAAVAAERAVAASLRALSEPRGHAMDLKETLLMGTRDRRRTAMGDLLQYGKNNEIHLKAIRAAVDVYRTVRGLDAHDAPPPNQGAEQMLGALSSLTEYLAKTAGPAGTKVVAPKAEPDKDAG